MQKKWFLLVIMGLAFSLLVPCFVGCGGTTAANTQNNENSTVTNIQNNGTPPATGTQSSDNSSTSDTQKNSSPPNTTLDGSQWKLISIDGKQLVIGSYISLYFRNGYVRGFAGGQLYGATYSLQAPDTLIISECYITTSGGAEDFIDQTTAYIKYLIGVTSYHFENDHLVIVNTAYSKALVFARLPEYQDPSALVGTKWRLVSLNDEPVLEGLSIMLCFDSKEQASGWAGPFSYAFHFKNRGEYVGYIGWGDLQITGGADNLTLQNLPPAEFQALHYLECFVPDNYRLTGDKLEIFTVRGDTLVYKTDSTK